MNVGFKMVKEMDKEELFLKGDNSMKVDFWMVKRVAMVIISYIFKFISGVEKFADGNIYDG